MNHEFNNSDRKKYYALNIATEQIQSDDNCNGNCVDGKICADSDDYDANDCHNDHSNDFSAVHNVMNGLPIK